MVDEGRTLRDALQRAALETGSRLDGAGIDLAELRAEIASYRALFHRPQLARLYASRRLALDAMRSLEAFRPRLAGALVHGDGPLDEVRLVLAADTPEDVAMTLDDRHIPWRDAEVMIDFASNRREARPALRFRAGDVGVELVILNQADRGRPPREPFSNQPATLLDAQELAALLEATAAEA